MSLIEAIEARAVEVFGTRGERTSQAICYVCWVMQVEPPHRSAIEGNYFMLRVKDCQTTRFEDPAYDKKVGDLVTYAIHFNQRT
jgi:hypothetical protein